MPDKEKEVAGLPMGGVFVILALLLSYFIITDQPFKTSRQLMPDEAKGPVHERPPVKARLWEDPFSAVQRSQSYAQKGAPECGLPVLARRIAEKLAKNSSQHLLVLGVMVFGGEHAENVEMRRRSRYAVLSALAEDGYYPDDAERLSYVDFRKPISEQSDAVSEPVDIMPYESFSPEASGPPDSTAAPNVFVLWLKDDCFRSYPFLRLKHLIAYIRKSVVSERKGRQLLGEIKFKLLGPAGSTTLKAMIHEKPASTIDDSLNDLLDVEMFSWSATADESYLLEEQMESSKSLVVGKNFPIWFYRTIGTDRQLMDALVAELKLRGIMPLTDHIVLISEWDTDYGRYLPRTFACSAGINVDFKNIHRFTYMRGIDGQISKANEPAKAPESYSQSNKKGSRLEGIEKPEGHSQFDYLRRLARDLKKIDGDLRKEGASIKAVGLLGSDIYDKLLVLQAIYELFPGAIFFTTDLDARFLHPNELEWTRNLVIASNFGLSLHPGLQKNTPPFRYSYQTSLFFATRLALTPDIEDQNMMDCLTALLKVPRVFEIGRTEACTLRTKSEPLENQGLLCKRLTDAFKLDSTPILSLHPDLEAREQIIPPARTLAVAAAALLFLCIFYLVSKEGWAISPETSHRLTVAVFTAGGLAVIGMLLLWLISYQKTDGEPLALLEGISIWPTVYLRLAALVVAGFFMYSICRRSRELEEELQDYFSFPKLWRAEPASDTPAVSRPPARGLPDLWEDYRRRTTKGARLKRVLLLAVPYATLCGTIIFVFGWPFVPFRGSVSIFAHHASLIPAIYAFNILLFWVVDATSMAVWFIKRIQNGYGGWSEKIKKLEAECLGIDAKELNDWIGIKVIVKLTGTDNQFIYYPILVIILLWAARLSYFDRFDLPLGLLIVILLGLGFSVSCAIRLRSKAEQFRQEVLARLWEKQVRLEAEGNGAQRLSKQIDLMISHIKSIRGGAFVPFLEQPWVRATLIFLTSGGGLTALQYLPWFQ